MITEGISKALADLRAAGCDADADRIESVLTKAEAVAWEIRGKAGKPWLRCTEEVYQDHVRRVGPEHARALYAHASSAEPAVKYTTGHCKNKAQPGGCQLHNLQCGYPSCDREPIQSPSVPVESLCSDCPPVGYPTEATRCTPCPRRCEPVASVPDGSAYSLAEIQHAWDAAVEQGDWEDFQANLYTPTNQEGAAP